MNTLVIEKSGKPMTTSLKVAEVFEKRHANILRTITVIRRALESTENAQLIFERGSYEDVNKQNRPMYLMDRDAFALLVFGFNGPKAIQVKVDFIEAFNTMELELMKARAKLVDSGNLPTILRMAADALDNIQAVEAPTPVPAPKKIKMALTKIPRNKETASVTHTLGNTGFKSIKITDFLVTEKYLKRIPNNAGNRPKFRKVPTHWALSINIIMELVLKT